MSQYFIKPNTPLMIPRNGGEYYRQLLRNGLIKEVTFVGNNSDIVDIKVITKFPILENYPIFYDGGSFVQLFQDP
ncbi:hypothetical protein Glove_67g132 [Diversispora epigaea]|uniref:Uncharacterized protein n=1 Tax=Diversispora epigaea TaxID=1348612 RepID=A0A397JCK0_9GLOM|nr:hypothetical protein Glove_67g132 [Diversispora epigaea]